MAEDILCGDLLRADRIDLKSLDEQLHQKHLSRALTLEKRKEETRREEETREIPIRHAWEIDASKLVIRSVIGRGTFGTVHRGIYDGQDVAEAGTSGEPSQGRFDDAGGLQ